MADKAFFVNPFIDQGNGFTFCKPLQLTLSGTVTDGDGNPLVREIRLYRREDWIFDYNAAARSAYAYTYSDEFTGEYSFTVNESSTMRWVVICIGKDGENTLVYQHVTTIEE